MFSTKTTRTLTIGLPREDTVTWTGLSSQSEVAAILYVHALDCWPQGVEVPADPNEAVNAYFGVHAPGEWFEVTERTSRFGGILSVSRTVRWCHPSDVCTV